VNTNVYQFEDRLAINIPFPALPPSQLRTEWVEEFVPGHFHEVNQWIPLEVGSMEESGRIPVFLPINLMSELDFDAERPIEIRLHGMPDVWFRAHKRTETGYYWRVWIPNRVQKVLKLQPKTYAFAWIRGYTLPYKISRPVRREVRNVIVEHMGIQYSPERITEDRWRWVIPETIESYSVLKNALAMNITPIAEVDRRGDLVIVDFSFSKPAGKVVAERMDFAYRNLAVRNYTATTEIDYPFLCEIRATYLTATPKQFYEPQDQLYIIQPGQMSDKRFMEISEALKITVYNVLSAFFQHAKPEHKYSTMSWADHIDAIEYVTTKVRLHKAYPKLPRSMYTEYETDSDRRGENEYYRCIKYVRILNEQSYKRKNLDMYVYLDEDISDVLMARHDVEVDANGFVWER